MRPRWPFVGQPVAIRLGGKVYVKSKGADKPGVIAHYREGVATQTGHLYLYGDGTYAVDHVDMINPDAAGGRAALLHVALDYVLKKLLTFR